MERDVKVSGKGKGREGRVGEREVKVGGGREELW